MKRSRIIPVIILIIVVALCVPKTYKIDKTLQAVEISKDNVTETRQVTVRIKGEHHVHLLENNYFEGKIIIDGLDVTQGELIKVLFDSSGYGGLTYKYNSDLIYIGDIYISNKADEMIICVWRENEEGTKSWSDDAGKVIAYPDMDNSRIQKRLKSYRSHK